MANDDSIKITSVAITNPMVNNSKATKRISVTSSAHTTSSPNDIVVDIIRSRYPDIYQDICNEAANINTQNISVSSNTNNLK